eukprot:Opistho-2@91975
MELRHRNLALVGPPAQIDSTDGRHREDSAAWEPPASDTERRPRPLFDTDDAVFFRGRGRILEALFRTPRNRRIFVALIFLVLGIATRFHSISDPHQVVFDEVHFGGFASKYIQRSYFFDVHPPLGKLLIALPAYLRGYDGSFTFKDIGLDYNRAHVDVPYTAMRGMPALLNALVVPLAFLTMMEWGFSMSGSVVAGVLVLFENSFVTQSRFILLDSMLIFFVATSVYCWATFCNLRTRAFSRQWWMWLLLLGASLSCALSVKWVGLFVIALIGVHTLLDLWRLIGDQKLSILDLVAHFMARVACLIIVPIVGYVFFYYIHFSILTISGPGIAFMSSDFVSGLQGVVKMDVASLTYGSQVTFKHSATGGYLHSHSHLYPAGSMQQQMTAYGFKDHNNWWLLRRPQNGQNSTDPSIRTGAIVYIEHVATEKGVYMHGYPPPVSKPGDPPTLFEVSVNDDDGHEWEVRVIQHRGEKGPRDATKQRDLLLGSAVRLVRKGGAGVPACAIAASSTRLPDWGFFQFEVTCSVDIETKDTVWIVDEANAAKAETFLTTAAETDRSGFLTRLRDIWDIQFIAWDANKRIKGEHVFGSRPGDWPVLKRGISYWQNNGKHVQVYLMGNPLVWWCALPAVAIYFVMGAIYLVRWRRGYRDFEPEGRRKFILVADFLVLGWFLHYAPFFAMERQLFLHHYLPAHLFTLL